MGFFSGDNLFDVDFLHLWIQMFLAGVHIIAIDITVGFVNQNHPTSDSSKTYILHVSYPLVYPAN